MDSVNIVVVDDDPLFCEIISRVFREEGYAVFVARTAMEAADLVTRHSVKLAIIDWKLGGSMNGVQLGRALRRQGIATFLVSGYSKDDVRDHWRDPLEGFLGFYQKGDINLLATLLRDVERVERSFEDTDP